MEKKKKVKKSMKRIEDYCKERLCKDCMYKKEYGFQVPGHCPIWNMVKEVGEKERGNDR